MASNTFGKLLTLTTYGESHGPAIGGVIDGFPAGLELDLAQVQKELERRRPGQSHITTTRKEEDVVEFLSGIFEGKSTGTPIGFMIRNTGQRSRDYSNNVNVYRPSHADYVYDAKFGFRDPFGGGRSSARETACRVVAGALAQQFLNLASISITAFVSTVGNISINKSVNELDLSEVDSNIVRCPDNYIANEMISLIEQVRKEGDTTGGVITCIIKNVPAGIGEPLFDKLSAKLAHAMFTLPAVKAFELGSGTSAVFQRGSEHNDPFRNINGKIRTTTNKAGGINGGISNGEDILFKVSFKPVSTIHKAQETVDSEGQNTMMTSKGRHDPCVVPRAVPIVEAMAALVVADLMLINPTRNINHFNFK